RVGSYPGTVGSCHFTTRGSIGTPCTVDGHSLYPDTTRPRVWKSGRAVPAHGSNVSACQPGAGGLVQVGGRLAVDPFVVVLFALHADVHREPLHRRPGEGGHLGDHEVPERLLVLEDHAVFVVTEHGPDAHLSRGLHGHERVRVTFELDVQGHDVVLIHACLSSCRLGNTEGRPVASTTRWGGLRWSANH